MGDWLFPLLVVGVGGLICWYLIHARYVLDIGVRGGRPGVRRGKVAAVFLNDVSETCRDFGITSGWVRGLPRGGRRVGLVFSRHFPPAAQQRIRNAWTMTG